MSSLVVKHLVIHGRVQGVGYRASFFYAANKAGVTGWVRNRHDGTVEAMVQGVPAAVGEVVAWSHEGPGLAHVERVDVDDGAGSFSEFVIKDTV